MTQKWHFKKWSEKLLKMSEKARPKIAKDEISKLLRIVLEMT